MVNRGSGKYACLLCLIDWLDAYLILSFFRISQCFEGELSLIVTCRVGCGLNANDETADSSTSLFVSIVSLVAGFGLEAFSVTGFSRSLKRLRLLYMCL